MKLPLLLLYIHILPYLIIVCKGFHFFGDAAKRQDLRDFEITGKINEHLNWKIL